MRLSENYDEKPKSLSDEQVKPKVVTQATIAGAFTSGTPYDKKSKRWNEITEAVTFWLAKDMMPIQAVEREGFKRLVKKLDPRYNIPGRKYFSQTALPQLYDECGVKLAATLA